MKKISTIALIIALAIIPILEISKIVEASTAANQPIFYSASSTAFTLTTTSRRLLATSTTFRRAGATIQPIHCDTGASGAFLRMSNDALATANTGTLAFASSTLILGEYMNQLPIVQGSVQGITNVGTCTVLVTEWRLTTQ